MKEKVVFMKYSTIGNRVNYSNNLAGVVEDEVPKYERFDDRDYLELVQYIKWDEGRHSIRICYYVLNHKSKNKKWRFSNRPLSLKPSKFAQLLRKASEKKWFKI